MKRGDKIKCIKNTGFERILELDKNYTIQAINSEGTLVDIGLNKLFETNNFILVKEDFTEERNMLEDILIVKDIEPYKLNEKIGELPYLLVYWGKKLAAKEEELGLLEDAYDIWYSNCIEQILTKHLALIEDDKSKKEFIKAYHAQAKEKRLLLQDPEKLKEYKNWQTKIHATKREVTDLEIFVKGIEKKGFALSAIKSYYESI